MNCKRSVQFATAALLLAQGAPAQIWCPPQAEWIQSFNVQGSPAGPVEHGTIHARFLGDTLVGGLITQRIKRDRYVDLGAGTIEHTELPTVYTRFGNGVVKVRLGQTTEFDTLLWMGAATGDHWLLPGVQNTYEYRVLHVDTVHVDGHPLRRLALELFHAGEGPVMADTLYERIGLLHADTFEPALPLPLAGNVQLQCYRDFALSFTAQEANACDFTLGEVPVLAAAAIGVFPNPATDRITLAGGALQGGGDATVVDATGHVQAAMELRPGQVEIELGKLPPGCYALVLRGEAGVRVARFIRL